MTRFTMAAMLAGASLALAACGGATTQPTSMTPSASAAAVAPEASTPTPSPTPTPSILPITSDDLVDALPTNPMLSKVQGFTFKENKNWVDGGDEGPEWAADAPLTKEQKQNVTLGGLRRVKPDKCEARAAFNFHGWMTAWSTGDYVKAAVYAKKFTSLKYFKNGLLESWQTVAFVMPVGAAQTWTRNLAATVDECDKYTTIASNGDIEKVNEPSLYKDVNPEWLEFGTAVDLRQSQTSGSRVWAIHMVWEPIGNILYMTQVVMYSDDAKQWARASALYNRLADSLAKAQAVERQPVDLNGGTPLIPDPAEYAPPAGPINSQA
jgi:hypothetical protein